MRGWTDLGSDVNWEDYGGKWAKADPTYAGRYYVIDFTNMEDACGSDATFKYACQVTQVDLTQIPRSEVHEARKSWGIEDEPSNGPFEDVACLESYGVGAPMEEFTSDTYPARLRANARRYAEQLMQDDQLVAERLSRPVNAIGSTARDFGRGDILAGLQRYAEGEGQPDQTKDLMLKIHGAGDLARG